MGLIEIDEVAVNADDWRLAKLGDDKAIARIQPGILGLELYMHNLILPNHGVDYSIVTLKELEAAGVIFSVKISDTP